MKGALCMVPTAASVPVAVCSFPPIAPRAARVLVLGSMPGAASLRAGRYYAHPNNAFWGIMGALFEAGPDVAYDKRVLILKRFGLALWDVMASCVREGSMDADIDQKSIVPNDFNGFFAAHPGVGHVFFNGAKAEAAFHRFVLPKLAGGGLHFTRLPSSSPAHALLSMAQKLNAWRAVARVLSSPQSCPLLAAAADLAPFLIQAILEKLPPGQRRFTGVCDFLVRDIALVSIVTGNLPQVAPPAHEALCEFFAHLK